MKLDPDCVRDLMLFCEDNTYIKAEEVGNFTCASYHVLYIDSMRIVPPLNKYDAGSLIYHVIQLSESGYLATDFHFDPVENFRHNELPSIYYVTPKGHEFIATIAEKSQWEKTAGILHSLGSVSLTVIETISKGIASAAIEQIIAHKA